MQIQIIADVITYLKIKNIKYKEWRVCEQEQKKSSITSTIEHLKLTQDAHNNCL